MIDPHNTFTTPVGGRREAASEGSSPQEKILLVLAGFIIPALLAYGFATAHELQVIAVTLGVLGMILIIARPFWGLIFFVALLYARPEESIPALAGMHLTLVISVVTLTGMIFKQFLDREKAVRVPLIGTMIGFVAMMAISSLFGGTLGAALQDGGRLLMLVLLIVNLCRTPARYLALVHAIIGFSSYLAIYSSYLLFTGVATIDEGIVRSRGTGIFSDPNDLAATMTAGLALALSRMIQERGRAKYLFGTFAAVMIYAIVLTNSRGGLIAMIAMLAGFFIVYNKNKARAIGLGIVVACLALAVAPSRMTNFDSQEESAASRFHFWQEAFNQLRTHPLTGVGYQQFAETNGNYKAHNSFVECFAEVGLPGYFFWIGGIYYAFKKLKPDVGEVGDSDGAATGDLVEAGGVITAAAPVSRNLIAARLAIFGYLAACFWITRTYTPVMYLLFSLPFAAQIAESGKTTLGAGSPNEQMRSWAGIVGVCVLSMSIIGLLVFLNR